MIGSMTPLVIDIYHGDSIDPNNGFHAIKDSGIVGIVHKATQGLGGLDPTYKERRQRADSVELKWGAYHFGVRGDGKVQAENFIDRMDFRSADLIALDWESYKRQMTFTQAEAFVETVHGITGRFPVLYTGYSFIKDAKVDSSSAIAQCPLWLARYNGTLGEVPRPWKVWTLWQFSGDGEGPHPHTCPGVLNFCDMNAYNGTADQLRQKWPFAVS